MLHPTSELADFIRKPNPAVLTLVNGRGIPVSIPVRYLVEGGGSVLLTVPAGNHCIGQLDQLRANPGMSLTIIDGNGRLDSASLLGAAFEIFDDDGLVISDELAALYEDSAYLMVGPRIAMRLRILEWIISRSAVEKLA